MVRVLVDIEVAPVACLSGLRIIDDIFDDDVVAGLFFVDTLR